MRKDGIIDWIACWVLMLFIGFVWSVTDAGLRSDIFDFASRHIDGTTVLAVFVIVGGACALFNLAFYIIRFRAE